VGHCLDGEGVFEFLHPGLQILDLALLLFQEQVFDAVKPCRHLHIKCLDLLVQCLHVLFAGHGALNHLGQAFNSSDVFLCHMYSSIDEPCAVSMDVRLNARPGRQASSGDEMRKEKGRARECAA
jgi:hypothetical protein